MILLTAAFPFVPAELNIAHFASTYVPADIAKRLLQIMGTDAKLVCASDYHSIYASRDGTTTDIELCQRYHKIYQRLFSLMHICFDSYITTDNPIHRENVKQTDLLLQKAGVVYRQAGQDNMCCQCGCCLPRRFQETSEENRCYFCSGTQIKKVSQPHHFLRLAGSESELRAFAESVSQKDVRNMILQYAKQPLVDWDYSRYNALGVSIPEDEGQSFYIWYDSLVGYYSLAQILGAKPERIVHFIGKNIVYYHSAIWQILAKQLFGSSTAIDISARGFLEFDKTPTSFVDLQALTARYHPDFIRFYLAFKVKDSMSDYTFSENDLENIVDYYCCRKIGGFFYRAWKCLCAATAVCSPYHPSEHGSTDDFVAEMESLVQNNQIHQALRLLLAHLDLANRNLLAAPKNQPDSSHWVTAVCYEAAVLECLVSAYMPVLYKAYSVFEQWNPQTLGQAKEYHLHSLKQQKEIVHLHGIMASS